MYASRIFAFPAGVPVVLAALLVAACSDGAPLGPGTVLSSVGEAPPVAAGPQSAHGEAPAELPFRLDGEATLLGQTLAPGSVPPMFEMSTFSGRCSVPAHFIVEFAVEAEASHLGSITAVAEHCTVIDFQAGTGTEIDGVMVFTAANGDELWSSYEGTTAPGQGFVETHEFTGGTGRFDGASGGATGTGACNQQTGTCVLEIEGVIVY